MKPLATKSRMKRDSAKRWGAMHHPFTAPVQDDPSLLQTDPGNAVARAYEWVCRVFISTAYLVRAAGAQELT